jgi:hypothetical protein
MAPNPPIASFLRFGCIQLDSHVDWSQQLVMNQLGCPFVVSISLVALGRCRAPLSYHHISNPPNKLPKQLLTAKQTRIKMLQQEKEKCIH